MDRCHSGGVVETGISGGGRLRESCLRTASAKVVMAVSSADQSLEWAAVRRRRGVPTAYAPDESSKSLYPNAAILISFAPNARWRYVLAS
jgi:peptidyl-tRNA hydrolase